MTDADGDGIWADTISLGRGDYQFIFLTGVAFVSGTDYEGFGGIANDCNVLSEAGSVPRARADATAAAPPCRRRAHVSPRDNDLNIILNLHHQQHSDLA